MKRFSHFLAIAALALLTACGPKDSEIQTNVNNQLQTTAGVTATVQDGVATLSGEVMSDADRAAAEAAAKGVKGVKSVVNNINVRPAAPVAPSFQATPDDALAPGVADALKDFPGATAEVRNGVIYVSGTLSADKWRRLKVSLDALNPQKVDATGLTVQ